MKKLLYLCALVLVIVAPTISSANGLSVDLHTSPGPIQVDSFFDIFFEIDGVDELYPLIGFELYCTKPDSWDLDSVMVNSIFDVIELSPMVSILNPIYDPPYGDDILLATFHIKPHEVGTFTFRIFSSLTDYPPMDGLFLADLDPDYDLNNIVDIDSSLNVTVNPAVPEPGTLLLFGTGSMILSGLGLKRRKSRKK